MGTKQVIDWKKPKDIVYGDALGDKQLNAKLSKGDGKLSYKPDKGHKPEAGKCVLTVTASKTKDFDATTEEVDLTVGKAGQDIEWKAPAAVTCGEELGDKQLNAKLKQGDGDLVYTPEAKTRLDAGKQVLKVTASATKNFEATEAEVTLVVDKAKPVIVWKDPKPMVFGDALSASELNADLKVGDGTLVYAKPAAIGIKPPGGKHTLRVDVAATKNYEAASATVTLVVAPVVQSIEADLPATFEYGTSYLVLSAFKGTLVSGKPVIDPPQYLKDFSELKPGQHKFTLKLAANANLLPYEREFEFEVLAPPPISVADWMKKLKFTASGNLFMKDLGEFGGAGPKLIAKGMTLHLSVFKSQLPMSDGVSGMATTTEVLDTLFPSNGNRGFHITLEYQVGETSLKNPHVYRDLATIYKGQGVTLDKDDWPVLAKKLTTRLDGELVKLKAAIVASKWCKG